jgi:Tfp pilus assembly protein FimV
VTDPQLAAVARDTLHGSALGTSYPVKAGDNLDRVIKKTMPNSPFSMEVMREAFARANPQLLSSVKSVKLKPGSTINVPSAAVLRQVVLGDPAPQAELKRVKAAELHSSAPVVAPTIAPTASDLNPPLAVPRLAPNVAYTGPAPEVAPDEKKKWVRFP